MAKITKARHAMERNFAKRRLSAMQATARSLGNSPALAQSEQSCLRCEVLPYLEILLRNWDSMNIISKTQRGV